MSSSRPFALHFYPPNHGGIPPTLLLLLLRPTPAFGLVLLHTNLAVPGLAGKKKHIRVKVKVVGKNQIPPTGCTTSVIKLLYRRRQRALPFWNFLTVFYSIRSSSHFYVAYLSLCRPLLRAFEFRPGKINILKKY